MTNKDRFLKAKASFDNTEATYQEHKVRFEKIESEYLANIKKAIRSEFFHLSKEQKLEILHELFKEITSQGGIRSCY